MKRIINESQSYRTSY